MNRDEMIAKGAAAVYEENFCDCGCPVSDAAGRFFARAFIDALLPQVTTVEELEALSVGTKVMTVHGEIWERHFRRWDDASGDSYPSSFVATRCPLTVVWQP